MADAATVHVSNISDKSSKEEIEAFFSFCGKVKDFSVTPTSNEKGAPLSATITFEQPSAARTALLLDNTLLSGVPIKVSASASLDQLQHEAHEYAGDETGLPSQDDKPRTAVFAEYLAHGYHFGDQVLQRAIDYDEKQGISKRFQKFILEIDNKHKVSDKSRAMDNTYGVSTRATQGYNTLTRYLDQALSTPTGQKVHKFYQDGRKQVLDIHNEAVRLKQIKAAEEKKCTCETAGPNGECNCAPGACACDGCKKINSEKAASGPVPVATEATASTSEKATYQ
ncbi:hypothetical protein TWF694_008876 [Orbilia ellipsospora]|uniref:RRM domain-containing protein n=1 Tax=Orbilia ellipsospora TaxID=2528407 RepID=A0AAV9XE70_9PEZI